MIAAKLLLAAALLTPLATDDCGAPPSSGGGGCLWFCPPAEQPQKKAPSGCPPNVAWVHPGAGTVTKVKVCPGLFGTEMHYIRVDSGPRQVWMADPRGSCQRGDDWTDAAGCE